MAKIVFVEKEEEQWQTAEANAKDAAEIFRLAERLSETELEKMQKTIAKMRSSGGINEPRYVE